jgi:hypothetical protein
LVWDVEFERVWRVERMTEQSSGTLLATSQTLPARLAAPQAAGFLSVGLAAQISASPRRVALPAQISDPARTMYAVLV